MLVSIFGSRLASGIDSAPSLPLGAQPAGTTVTFNGIPAPLLYASPADQRPSAGRNTGRHQRKRDRYRRCRASAPFPALLTATRAPGIFTADAGLTLGGEQTRSYVFDFKGLMTP